MSDDLPPIGRPNGKLYRPRKVVAWLLDSDRGERDSMVLVLGTHDVGRATALAREFVADEFGAWFVPVFSGCGWWRDGMEHGGRCWVADDERGAAGVLFGRIEEVPGA